MSYNFTPMSDEQLAVAELLVAGDYDFKVINSTKRFSQNNNEMAELQLAISDKNGKEKIVYDYLIFSGLPFNIRKIKHFCESVGVIGQYFTGQLPENFSGYSGRAKIDIQEKQPKKNGGGFYDEKNIVEDYVGKKDKENIIESSISINSPSSINFNGDIPF